MSELGARNNAGKRKWSLVDFKSLEPMVEVLEFGARKYAAHNWMKGLKVTEIMESFLRHAHAYLGGEDNDPESGISHIGHMQCNMMFLAYMHRERKDLDDRYKRENNSRQQSQRSEINHICGDIPSDCTSGVQHPQSPQQKFGF